MSYTVGPWVVTASDPSIGAAVYWVTAGGKYEREVATVSGPHSPINEANAWLIASAPDMLQVLKDIDAASWEINSKLGERIRGAIRQAEGETK